MRFTFSKRYNELATIFVVALGISVQFTTAFAFSSQGLLKSNQNRYIYSQLQETQKHTNIWQFSRTNEWYQEIQMQPSSPIPRQNRAHYNRIFHILSSSTSNESEKESKTKAKNDVNETAEANSPTGTKNENTITQSKTRISKRQTVINLAKSIVENAPTISSLSSKAPAAPQVIGALLKDAAEGAVGFSNTSSSIYINKLRLKTEAAFSTANKAIDEAQTNLVQVKQSLEEAKLEAMTAISEAEAAQLTLGSFQSDTQSRLSMKTQPFTEEVYTALEDLSYDDIDYELSEMAPPFIGEDMCLVPGVPLVRVEKAPENSRRIFAGIDIMAGVDDVWNLLTDYDNLQQVVPNLVVNEVLELYSGDSDTHTSDYEEKPDIPSDNQCQNIANKLKGAKLKQVGGAKVVGINFSARTTLEVREWPEGMPDFAHFNDDIYAGESREKRVQNSKTKPLQRYFFPRPFAMSKLPTKDISMQSILNDDGEFRIYQGVWRMQPLVGCSAPGSSAMRLTYAVEISPRAYLPVRLVEGRIAQDLCANLESIRDFVQV